METAEVYRSREIVFDDELQTLLNSLTLDQIRSAIFSLNPTKKIVLKSRKEAMSALLSTNKSSADIRKALLEIEGSSPFRNCVFSKMAGVQVAANALKLAIDGTLKSTHFNLKLSFVAQTSTCITLTLEHTVRVLEWVDSGPLSKKKQENSVRHPIVIRLYSEHGIAAFFYPGFHQGTATPRGEGISYEALLKDAMSFIGDLLSINFSALPVRDCIKVLLEGANTRMRVVRSEVDGVSGRVSLSSAFQEKPVEEVLADYLGPQLSPELRALVVDLGRKALGTSTANTVVLYWYEEKIVTRLRFWEIGTDMLFVWHGVPNSFRIVEDIVNLFQTTYKMLPESGDSENPLDWLSKLEAGRVVRPAEIASDFALSPEKSREVLLSAMSIGLLKPVYRLRTNLLLIKTPNDWIKNPSDLNYVFEADNGEMFDGRIPSNVEVAFLRVDNGSVA